MKDLDGNPYKESCIYKVLIIIEQDKQQSSSFDPYNSTLKPKGQECIVSQRV